MVPLLCDSSGKPLWRGYVSRGRRGGKQDKRRLAGGAACRHISGGKERLELREVREAQQS